MVELRRFIEEWLLIMVQLDIVVALLRDAETRQRDVAHLPNSALQMSDRLFDCHGNIGVKLLKEILPRYADAQISDWKPQRLRIVGDRFGNGDRVQGIKAGEHLQ